MPWEWRQNDVGEVDDDGGDFCQDYSENSTENADETPFQNDEQEDGRFADADRFHSGDFAGSFHDGHEDGVGDQHDDEDDQHDGDDAEDVVEHLCNLAELFGELKPRFYFHIQVVFLKFALQEARYSWNIVSAIQKHGHGMDVLRECDVFGQIQIRQNQNLIDGIDGIVGNSADFRCHSFKRVVNALSHQQDLIAEVQIHFSRHIYGNDHAGSFFFGQGLAILDVGVSIGTAVERSHHFFFFGLHTLCKKHLGGGFRADESDEIHPLQSEQNLIVIFADFVNFAFFFWRDGIFERGVFSVQIATFEDLQMSVLKVDECVRPKVVSGVVVAGKGEQTGGTDDDAEHSQQSSAFVAKNVSEG